jgi:kinesin family member 22
MQGTSEQPGVIPRTVRGLFDARAPGAELSISYLEIHKDEVYDLLVNRADAPKLPVRENDVGRVFVANLTKLPITSVDEFDSIFACVFTIPNTNFHHGRDIFLTIQ